MQRRTRIWVGLGTALLVGSTGVERVAALAPADAPADTKGRQPAIQPEQRIYVAQADAAGEGGPNEGGGPVLGTITEFRLSTTDASAFAYDAAAEVSAYVDLVTATYGDVKTAASVLRETVGALAGAPSPETLDAARSAWLATRDAYLRTEAYLFYAGPADGPGGPYPRLNMWPVDPAGIDTLVGDANQSLNFRAIARLNTVEPAVRITTGLHVIEYLLWGADGALTADAFANEARRGEYATAVAQLFLNDIAVVTAAWAPDTNNYRASVEAMDQRNALGRAFNGMAALLGYEIPLRRIGAGLFPANENFQPSPFSQTSAEDLRASFEGAKAVYVASLADLIAAHADAELAAKIAAGFERADAAIAAMGAPYERFLAPSSGSPDRAIAEEAVRALTDLARDIRQAGNRLGILVVVPGM